MSAGGEKRIQALYFDLVLEDQSRAPVFNTLWNRALGPHASLRASAILDRRFARLLVGSAVTASIIAATFFGLALWPRRTEVVHVNAPSTQPSVPDSERKWVAITLPERSNFRRATTRRTRVKAADKVSQSFASISNWRSPTELFMQSMSDSVLKSMPAFDQSVKAMQSFLPKEHSKERNQ